MKSAVSLTALAVVMAAAAANAADLPRSNYYAPVQPVATAFNWSGAYAGANVGYQWGETTNNPTRPSGIMGGVTGGYNWQSGQFVFGGEADLNISGADDTFAPWKFSNPWFGTLRGRAGYIVFDRWLPYLTGGLAYGTRTASGTASGAATGGYKASDTSVGWALGVGVDYAINPAWTARLEYLHISLDSFSPTYSLTGGTVSVAYGRLENDIIRGALNYRLTTW